MTILIRELDPLLSSQIAAGEVVERPASVVKELVENAIDAGANRISVEIVDGGMRLVRVSDNGSGMSRDDALLSLKRFATSKICTLGDLDSIKTLGFRGEAIPSIASCSKLTIETKSRESTAGLSLCVEGGNLIGIKEKGLPIGSTFIVQELFFNIPARLKFMKSRATERNAVIEMVERLALAWPNISFTLKSQNRAVFHTTGNGLKDALADIFGPEIADSALEIEYENEGIELSGFIGLPKIYRRSRDRQVFSVNRRPIKNPSLGWALDHAFAGLLPPRSFAVAFMNIAVEPGNLDVNVHPTKSEIRFENEQAVRRAITQSVKGALSRTGYLKGLSVDDWTKRSKGSDGYVFKEQNPAGSVLGKIPETRSDSFSRTQSDPDRKLMKDGLETFEWHYLGSLLDTYLIAKTVNSLLIVDQHALAESLAFQSLCQGKSGSQELLIPEIVSLEPKEAALYEERGHELDKVGFSARPIGTRTLLVSKVPLILGQALPADSLKEVLLNAYQSLGPNIPAERVSALAQIATAACHASVKGKQSLGKEEALALLRSLWANPTARTCPHGRPTVFELPRDEIDRFFGR